MGLLSRLSSRWAHAEAKTWIDGSVALVFEASQLCPQKDSIAVLRLAHRIYLKKIGREHVLDIAEAIDSQLWIFACLPSENAQLAYAMSLAHKQAPDALNNATEYQAMFASLMGELFSLHARRDWPELNRRFALYNPTESNKGPFKDTDPAILNMIAKAKYG